MAGTLTGVNLISRIQDILQDTTSIRWPAAELLRYVNDAQREVCNLRPESTATTVNVALVVGTKQSLPSGGLRLIKVTRNMSAAGGSATGKRAVRLVDADILNTQEPNWHDPGVSGDAAHTTTVKHYIFDEDDPRNFYVYPGASTTSTFLELVYSAAPTDLGSVSATISVDDIFGNALIDYTLFRCYLKDAEYAANQQRAGTHYQLFVGSVSAGGQAQFNVSPNQDVISSLPAYPQSLPPQGMNNG
jgi:hypothetical protein